MRVKHWQAQIAWNVKRRSQLLVFLILCIFPNYCFQSCTSVFIVVMFRLFMWLSIFNYFKFSFSADVGGFFGNPEPELLVRWYQVRETFHFFIMSILHARSLLLRPCFTEFFQFSRLLLFNRFSVVMLTLTRVAESRGCLVRKTLN